MSQGNRTLLQKDGYLPFSKGFSTLAIHHSQEPEQWDSRAIATPIVTSTIFKQGNVKNYVYGRNGNPTREVLENVLAKLDNALYGLTFPSGMAAATIVAGMLKSGDNMIVGNDIYSGSTKLFNQVFSTYNIEITTIDMVDLTNLENAIKPNTKLIWAESPTNPNLKVIDIKAASAIAKKNNIILAIDNTFLTPYLQRPLDLGADLAVYSVTKYMNGHTDVFMGSISTNDKALYGKLKYLQTAMGLIPSPFDCYQVIRSLKTLALRMKQHRTSGLIVAKYLESHPRVEKVLHPGLPSHPQYELSKKQTSGHSGVFSFILKGNLQDSKKLLNSLKLFTPAGSLGGYESLVSIPSIFSHSSLAPELKKKLGITDNLLRLSVGLEDVEDLVADLEEALKN